MLVNPGESADGFSVVYKKQQLTKNPGNSLVVSIKRYLQAHFWIGAQLVRQCDFGTGERVRKTVVRNVVRKERACVLEREIVRRTPK